MNGKSLLRYLALACLAFAGCEKKVPIENTAQVFRLFDLFQPDDLVGKLNPEEADWKQVKWAATDFAPWTPTPAVQDTNSPTPPIKAPAFGFRGINDLADLKVSDGKLTGNITGPTPILQFSLNRNRGGAEPLKFIELLMNVSGARQVLIRSDMNATGDEAELVKWASQADLWTNAVEVVPDKFHTYQFDVQKSRWTNQNSPDLRQFLVVFHDCNAAKFSIESVRFITEREEKLKEASGQQWAGLAEIYRATLAAKTPESIRIPLRELPAGAHLDFAIGTKEDSPVKFTLAISDKDGSKEKESTGNVVYQRTVTIPNRWQTARVDLSAYAGKSVVAEFSLAGEMKGLWGYWGSPVVRSGAGSASASDVRNGSGNSRKPRGVILFVSDTLRKDHLNIYGYPRDTLVYLKKFAEEGVAFNHAISQGTMTKISVPSIVTSLYPLSNTVLGFEKGLPASAKTLAEVFHEAGYATVAYSSVPFTGKSNNMHQGYDELHEIGSISDNEYRAKTSRHYVDRLIPWLQEHRDAPFFVFLHVFDPHSPFRPRPPYDTIWGAPGSKERLAELEADMKKHKVGTALDNLPHKADYLKTGNDPEELLKIYKDWYDGSIRGMDAEIGRLLETLRELGLDQDTLIVWSADHGEEFWEHGKFFHGHTVYGELNQVPLVFRWPNCPDIRKGAMVEQQIENIDIMPTILALAGLKGPTEMQGRSLVPLLNGTGTATWEERPAITQAMVRPDMPPGTPPGPVKEKAHFGIIDHGWKLVRKEVDPEAQQELYEHPIDDLNLTNVIQSDISGPHVKTLSETLESWKSKARAAELPNDETMTQQLSSEELRRLRALGYVGGTTPAKPSTNPPPTKTTSTTNAADLGPRADKKAVGQ